MRFLIVILTIIISCTVTKKIDGQPKLTPNSNDTYRDIFRGLGGTTIFGEGDTVTLFLYQYLQNPKANSIRVYISSKTNKAILFRFEEAETIDQSYHQFSIKNPFTGKKILFNITQQDTIQLNKQKWKTFNEFIAKHPLANYKVFTREHIPKNVHGIIQFPNHDRTGSLIRTQKYLEPEFKKMCELLFDLVGINDIPLDKPKIVNPLSGFENLVGGTWKIEATMKDGQPFIQEQEYEWSLDKKIIKVKTYGIINEETQKYGLRSEGIRAIPAEEKIAKFWEFDIFGGVMIGNCEISNKNISYIYEYGERLIEDKWVYIDTNTYEFSITMIGGERKHELLKGIYKRTF